MLPSPCFNNLNKLEDAEPVQLSLLQLTAPVSSPQGQVRVSACQILSQIMSKVYTESQDMFPVL